MGVLRKLLSALLGLVFSVLCLLTVVTAASNRGKDWSILRSQKIEQHLTETSQYVSAHLARHGQLPDQSDLQRWKREAPDLPLRQLTWWTGPPFSKKVRAAFGNPPATVSNPYVVVFWEGDRDEYYSSWTQTSTLLLDRASHYMFGSRTAETALFALLALLSAFLSIKVWPRTAGVSRPA